MVRDVPARRYLFRNCDCRWGQPAISIRLTPSGRQGLVDHDRWAADTVVRLRSRNLVLVDAGDPEATVGADLFCSAGIRAIPARADNSRRPEVCGRLAAYSHFSF